MSVYDDFVALRDKLFAQFDAPNATIVRTTAQPRDNTNRAAGQRGTVKKTTRIDALAIRSTKTTTDQDGTTHYETQLKLDTEVRPGDAIEFADATYTVETVKEINPTGSDPILWTAIVK